ncbi:ABC transporter substrate-binding protein [Sodalis sp. dw_96]|uniref:ABC transporter substrate-binding protein n=1 Tax=Sodalis sp. dw_96 TaxID=2719794 RepID=UPI001BD51E6C|nr:ABC transporter substrate-binding protein [Sodalis sp. dw_96]
MTELLLAHGEALSNLPLFVAQAWGFFRDRGLTVTVPKLSGTSSTIALLRSGAAQIGTTGFTQPLSDYGAADPLRIIAGSGVGGMAVMIHPDSVATAPAALRFGTFFEDPMEVLLYEAIDRYQGAREHCDIRYFDTLPQAITAMRRREIDACTFIEPMISQLEELGFKKMCDAADVWGADYPDTVLVTRQRFLQQHPDVVDAVIKALLEAENAIKADPRGTLSSVAGFYPGVPLAVLMKGLARQPPQIDIRPLGGVIINRFQALVAMGRLTPPDDPCSVLDFSRLSAMLAQTATEYPL